MTEHVRHMYKVKNHVMLKHNEKIVLKPRVSSRGSRCNNHDERIIKDKKRKANSRLAKEGISKLLPRSSNAINVRKIKILFEI